MNKKQFVEMVQHDMQVKRKSLRDKMFKDFRMEHPKEILSFRVKRTFLKYFDLYIQALQEEAQD